MHEFSIAAGLVEKLLEFAAQNPDKKIAEVRLAVGELSNVEEEQLRFCYESITTETALASSTLRIESVPAKVQCPHCSFHGRPKYWEGALHGIPVATLECPQCGKAADAVDGRECAIKSLRVIEVQTAETSFET